MCVFIHTYMCVSTLTKKDIIAFNQQIGEAGKFSNESSLDFALSLAKTKKNWLYELSYIARCLLVDYIFQDGNKRTCFLVASYYFEEKGEEYDNVRLLSAVKKIAKNNVNSPPIIMRLLYNAVKEKD